MGTGLIMRQIAGIDVYWHEVDECASTIELCDSLLDEAPDDIPVIVLAAHQSNGRGRFDRTWIDEPHSGVLMSIGRRSSVDASLLAGLPLAMAEALRRALVTRAWIDQDAATIKPPNDLLVSGAKLAGLLATSQSTGGGVEQIVLSCGLNVLGPERTIDATRATTLEALGADVNVGRAADVVAEAIVPAIG